MTDTPTPKVPRKISYLSLAGIFLVMAMTLANAAANMLPGHFPTAREKARAVQEDVAAARRVRIVWLLEHTGSCDAPSARELARALVFDGRSAVPFAIDYEGRCGDDPIIDRWREASLKLVR
jgi:hypothetical protein